MPANVVSSVGCLLKLSFTELFLSSTTLVILGFVILDNNLPLPTMILSATWVSTK